MEVLIFYADKLMVMGSSNNSCVFNFTILLKSRKFDARKIYRFYSISEKSFQEIKCSGSDEVQRLEGNFYQLSASQPS